MPGPIPIISDTPNSKPGLGFTDYVEALADSIRGAEPAQLTIGLYGAWGTGKSSLLSALARELKSDEILVVEFDAWRYERAEHIVVPLLYNVVKAGEKHEAFLPTVQQLKKFLGTLISSMTIKLPALEINGTALAEAIEADPMDLLDAAFGRPFEELRRIQRTLKNKRVVVLIDDLDRCAPNKVVDVLEAINLVMDIQGFIFVLALDYDVLVEAVTHKYTHVDGHEFIQKMVQLPFRVPPLPTSSTTLMRDLIPRWSSFVAAHSASVVNLLTDVAQSALRGNPRQIKRLVNYVLLLERIVERRGLRVTTDSLVVIISLQLAWPALFRDAQDSAMLGSSTPFDGFLQNADGRVAAFAKRHLADFENGEALTRLLQLTRAVESPSDRSAEVPTLVRVHSAGVWGSLITTLDFLGWDSTVSADGKSIFYRSSAYPRILFVLGLNGFEVALQRHGGTPRPLPISLSENPEFRSLLLNGASSDSIETWLLAHLPENERSS